MTGWPASERFRIEGVRKATAVAFNLLIYIKMSLIPHRLRGWTNAITFPPSKTNFPLQFRAPLSHPTIQVDRTACFVSAAARSLVGEGPI